MLKKLLNCLPKHHFVLWPTMNDDTCFSIFPSAFCIFSILDLTFLIGIGWYIIIILIWSFLVILNIFLSLLGIYIYTSVQFSHPVVSDSLWPHKSKHARPPCPSPTPGVYSNSCPLSQWCHPTISSSVVPFSSCPQSLPASGFFLMNQFFISGGQSIIVSTSASVLPMNIQDWFPLGWSGWISLKSKELSRVFSNTTVQKHQFFSPQLSL